MSWTIEETTWSEYGETRHAVRILSAIADLIVFERLGIDSDFAHLSDKAGRELLVEAAYRATGLRWLHGADMRFGEGAYYLVQEGQGCDD